MKHFLCLILLSALSFTSVSAQSNRYLEAGFLFGLTNYSGDLSERRVELNETKPGYGAYLRYHFNPHFSTKAHVYSGSIGGDDANTSRAARAFRFSTNIIELGMVGEWNILGKKRYSKTGIHQFFMTPYVFGGLGVTFANAEAEFYTNPDLLNDYIKDPDEFNVTQRNRFLLAPVGVGLRADIREYLVIGVEGGLRPVFSDKLDGIENNANPESGDWYYFAGVTISFVINRRGKR